MLMQTKESEAGDRVPSLNSTDPPSSPPERLLSFPAPPPQKAIFGFDSVLPLPLPPFPEPSRRAVPPVMHQAAGRAEQVNGRYIEGPDRSGFQEGLSRLVPGSPFVFHHSVSADFL